MSELVYDFEVFKHDWIVVVKDHDTGQRVIIHNDNDAFASLVNEQNIFIGFNSKHYDRFIAEGVCAGFTPEKIKKINDWIIVDKNQGWDCPLLKGNYFRMNNIDVMDDMQKGQSLKSIEGHLFMDIQETEVDFNLDRPLTAEELTREIGYCCHDVDATEKIFELRKPYYKSKLRLASMAHADPIKYLGMTNAKITADMLHAKATPHDDERKYKYRENLQKQYIPQNVFDYFNRMYDPKLSDDEVFRGDKLTFDIDDCVVVMGMGGIHGAIPHFEWKKVGNRIILNYDVGSYYPHLMTICGYTSRNIPNPEIFIEILDTRMKYKAAGDKANSNALKLVVNTKYGAMLNPYNDLYDPLMARSVCISGQLYLLEMAEHLKHDIPDLKIVQLNTDGIMIECNRDDYGAVQDIVNEWQKRTGFELEEDRIKYIVQKDVNNYIEIQDDGSVKYKGGYLVRGVAKAGAFKVNNNANIVAKAIIDYYTKGIPVEETINNCNDIKQFQLITKVGSMFTDPYWMVDGQKVPTQRVNRIYATADERYGKLYKMKGDRKYQMSSIPDHCIIDNSNKLDISAVDKTYYIHLAQQRVNEFRGIKPKKERKKKMATTTKTSKNVYQKLIEARAKFLSSGAKQTGKNMHLEFKYFELEDIVPEITKIFVDLGLIAIDNFTADTATLTIVNTDKPEETITFTAPFNQIEPIISNSGKQATNNMQALGSSITYMRRYLYLIAMDVCVLDDIEPNIDKDTNKTEPEKVKTTKPAASKPATPAQREEIKKELTSPEEPATDLQIKGLKNVLKKLRKKDSNSDEFVAKIAVDTDGFTHMTKAQCEEYMKKVNDLLELPL